MDDVIAPMVDELNRALGIDSDTLERELTLLIVEYKVPPEEARRSLLKKYRRPAGAGRAGQPAEARWAHAAEVPLEEQNRLLKDARVGDTGITIVASVKDPVYREASSPGGGAPVISGTLEDATAKLHFTSWVDIPDIFSVRAIVARDVYVKSFHGMPSININERSVLEEYQGVTPRYVRQRKTLCELSQTDGAYDVEAEGDVLSLRPGSGLIERCPGCSRVLQKGQCRAHGRVEGVPDLRIKAVLDDGTGSMICVLDRALTEKLVGMTTEELGAQPERSAELIRAAVVGTPLIVTGNVTKGDFGMIFVAGTAERPPGDAAALARALLGGLR
jgi:replication factor A1